MQTEYQYNKREMYFTNREMIAKRMNETLPHVLCKTESKPTSCVWCCRKKHDQSDPKKHTRHGRTTKYGCPVCMVSLCRVKRVTMELFHSSKSLVDYCRSEMDAVVHVVPHRNRPPPPTRRARPALDSDNDEESNRRTRSRITRSCRHGTVRAVGGDEYHILKLICTSIFFNSVIFLSHAGFSGATN